MAVILVSFADVSIDANCTHEFLSQRVFGASNSVRAFYDESSFGQLSIVQDADGDNSPDVFGPVVIDSVTTAPCDIGLVWDQADAAAAAAGLDLSAFQHRMYVVPSASDCGNWGYVGCDPPYCRSMVEAFPPPFECGILYTYSHEFGHNLGMHHSSVDLDNDGGIDPGGEYGDKSDVMGHCCATHPQPNTPHKIQQSWFEDSPGQVIDVQGGSQGQWEVFASEIGPASAPGPQALRLGGRLLVSTRAAIGFDHDIDWYEDQKFVGRASIHRDGRPAWMQTLLLKTLGDGDTFEDAQTGISVTQVGHTATSVTLDVSLASFVFHDGFETGDSARWSSSSP